MTYKELLKQQFDDQIKFREKSTGTTQLILPFYHEDGDMVDIFLEKQPEENGLYRICDHGMTLMRLSYQYSIDTPNKERIFKRILSENYVNESNGNLYIDCPKDNLYAAILQLIQTSLKITSMQYFKREVLHSLFLEHLTDFIETKLIKFQPQKSYCPIPNHEEYEVDYCFNNTQKPIFLWGVNSVSKARLATVTCQKFLLDKMKFRSLIVLDNLETLGKKDQARLMAVADKEFPSLNDFINYAELYLERELLD